MLGTPEPIFLERKTMQTHESETQEDSEPSGIIEAGDGGEVLDEEPTGYSYHYEPPSQGGARYVRCECCGVEGVPAKPERLSHRAGCPNANE